MAVAGPVVEAPSLAALGVIAVCSVCIALLYAYNVTLGAVLQVIANNIDVKISIGPASARPFAFIASGINALNSVVRNALGTAIQANSWAWRKFVNWQAYLWHETTRVIGDLADETHLTLHWLVRHHLGAVIAAALNPIGTAVDLLRKQVPALAHDIAHLGHVTTRVIVHEIPKITQHVTHQTEVIVKRVAYAVPAAVANPWPRLWHVEREVKGIEDRVNGLGRKLALPVMVGLVAASLEKLGLNAARCSRTQRWDKHLCGMDQSLLDSLIADTLLILGTVSLVDAARDMQEIVEPLSDSVRHFWRAD
jgi:hypothetical protein